MSILVTGGTGYLGSEFVRHLVLEKDERPVVLDRYPDRDRVAPLGDRVTVVAGDVLEPRELSETIVRHRVDRIAHFAFPVGAPLPGRAFPYARLGTLGTANVFEAARIHGVARVMNASSVDAFGQHPGSADEDDPKQPDNVYGASKLWSEQLAREYRRGSGLDVISLRFCATFGP